MSAIAATLVASLFSLAALFALAISALTWLRYAPTVRTLKHQLAQCPDEILVRWTSIERGPLAPRPTITARQAPEAPKLVWPGLDLPLAA